MAIPIPAPQPPGHLRENDNLHPNGHANGNGNGAGTEATYTAYSPSPSEVAAWKERPQRIRDWRADVPPRRREGVQALNGQGTNSGSSLSMGGGVGAGSAVWSERDGQERTLVRHARSKSQSRLVNAHEQYPPRLGDPVPRMGSASSRTVMPPPPNLGSSSSRRAARADPLPYNSRPDDVTITKLPAPSPPSAQPDRNPPTPYLANPAASRANSSTSVHRPPDPLPRPTPSLGSAHSQRSRRSQRDAYIAEALMPPEDFLHPDSARSHRKFDVQQDDAAARTATLPMRKARSQGSRTGASQAGPKERERAVSGEVRKAKSAQDRRGDQATFQRDGEPIPMPPPRMSSLRRSAGADTAQMAAGLALPLTARTASGHSDASRRAPQDMRSAQAAHRLLLDQEHSPPPTPTNPWASRQPNEAASTLPTDPRALPLPPSTYPDVYPPNTLQVPSASGDPTPQRAPNHPGHRQNAPLRPALTRSYSSMLGDALGRQRRDPSTTNLQARFEPEMYPLPASVTTSPTMVQPSPAMALRFPDTPRRPDQPVYDSPRPLTPVPTRRDRSAEGEAASPRSPYIATPRETDDRRHEVRVHGEEQGPMASMSPSTAAGRGDADHISFEVPSGTQGRLRVSLAWFRDPLPRRRRRNVESYVGTPPPLPPEHARRSPSPEMEREPNRSHRPREAERIVSPLYPPSPAAATRSPVPWQGLSNLQNGHQQYPHPTFQLPTPAYRVMQQPLGYPQPVPGQLNPWAAMSMPHLRPPPVPPNTVAAHSAVHNSQPIGPFAPAPPSPPRPPSIEPPSEGSPQGLMQQLPPAGYGPMGMGYGGLGLGIGGVNVPTTMPYVHPAATQAQAQGQGIGYSRPGFWQRMMRGGGQGVGPEAYEHPTEGRIRRWQRQVQPGRAPAAVPAQGRMAMMDEVPFPPAPTAAGWAGPAPGQNEYRGSIWNRLTGRDGRERDGRTRANGTVFGRTPLATAFGGGQRTDAYGMRPGAGTGMGVPMYAAPSREPPLPLLPLSGNMGQSRSASAWGGLGGFGRYVPTRVDAYETRRDARRRDDYEAQRRADKEARKDDRRRERRERRDRREKQREATRDSRVRAATGARGLGMGLGGGTGGIPDRRMDGGGAGGMASARAPGQRGFVMPRGLGLGNLGLGRGRNGRADMRGGTTGLREQGGRGRDERRRVQRNPRPGQGMGLGLGRGLGLGTRTRGTAGQGQVGPGGEQRGRSRGMVGQWLAKMPRRAGQGL